MLLFLMAAVGCRGSKQTGITGYVFAKNDIAHSYILGGSFVDPDYTPNAGARVCLALDKEGKRIVNGCEVESDATGRYHLDTKDCPPATNFSGDYYLVVQKEGYEPFTHRISVGPLAPYRENRIVLKALSKL
jgi:hypothetical protein